MKSEYAQQLFEDLMTEMALHSNNRLHEGLGKTASIFTEKYADVLEETFIKFLVHTGQLEFNQNNFRIPPISMELQLAAGVAEDRVQKPPFSHRYYIWLV